MWFGLVGVGYWYCNFPARSSSINYNKHARFRAEVDNVDGRNGRLCNWTGPPSEPRPRISFYPTPTPTPTMVNLDASSWHAGPISEPLKVRLSNEKRILQVDDHAQRVLVTGGAGYIGWYCPSPPPIDR